MSLPFRRLTATVYRGHNPRWACAPASGEGARRHGGRFNPPGMDCLYTALSPETAWLEAQQGFAFKAQPLTLVAYEADCEAVLDLTDSAVRRAARVRPADLACPWEGLASQGEAVASWTLAKRLSASGAAGIIVPSFASRAGPQDINAVFWRWSERPPHQVRAIDSHDRLPKNDLSWR